MVTLTLSIAKGKRNPSIYFPILGTANVERET